MFGEHSEDQVGGIAAVVSHLLVIVHFALALLYPVSPMPLVITALVQLLHLSTAPRGLHKVPE